MPTQKLTLIVRILAKPAYVTNVKDSLLSLIEPTLKEVGCINYDLHQDNENPNLFFFFENWESEAHLKKHSQSDHLNAHRKRVKGMIENIVSHKMKQL